MALQSLIKVEDTDNEAENKLQWKHLKWIDKSKTDFNKTMLFMSYPYKQYRGH